MTRPARFTYGRASLAVLASTLLLSPAGCSSDAEASTPHDDGAAEAQPATPPPDASSPTYDPRESLAPLIDAVGPAVVSIRARGRKDVPGFFGSSRHITQGSGSGFIISEGGIVVTNHHVIDGAEQLDVAMHDGRSFVARVVGSDPETDLAVLQLEGAKGLPTTQFADSDALRVGDWVVAIGNPMGLDHSASVGIVSGRGRGSLGLYADSYIDFLQTDADIAPGSSGGPLFDLKGQVVGITTAVGAASGPGFAIPSSQAQHVLAQLQENGHVVRGWLGAGNEPESARDDNAVVGATIGQVFADTPAAEAGLQRGDVIKKVDNQTIRNFDALRRVIALTEPGHTVLLEVERAGKSLELTTVVKERPRTEELSGMRMHSDPRPFSTPPRPLSPPTATPGIGEKLGVQVKEDDHGLAVVRVEPRSLAADLDLQAGDVIVTINGEVVHSPSDVASAISRSHDRIEVEMIRDGVKHKVSLERS